jgi:hypothetical protein
MISWREIIQTQTSEKVDFRFLQMDVQHLAFSSNASANPISIFLIFLCAVYISNSHTCYYLRDNPGNPKCRFSHFIFY